MHGDYIQYSNLIAITRPLKKSEGHFTDSRSRPKACRFCRMLRLHRIMVRLPRADH